MVSGVSNNTNFALSEMKMKQVLREIGQNLCGWQLDIPMLISSSISYMLNFITEVSENEYFNVWSLIRTTTIIYQFFQRYSNLIKCTTFVTKNFEGKKWNVIKIDHLRFYISIKKQYLEWGLFYPYPGNGVV